MRLVINEFGGMVPRLADRLLPDANATHAANARLTSGSLRGFGSLQELAGVASGTWQRVARLYRPGVTPSQEAPDPDDYVWWVHADRRADVLVSPLVNDAFDRVYYAAPTHSPRLTTLDDIEANQAAPAYVALGVARPTTAPTVGHSGGASSTNETRAYVYTWQTAYGEISAPSPAALHTAPIDATSWGVTLPGSGPSVATKILVYRSSTTDTSAEYYKVGEVTIGTTSLTDTLANDDLPLQSALESDDHDPPVSTIRGFVQHSSGALAGFSGRDVYFSRPWLPHAWPGSWRYTVSDEIVGLAPLLNGIVVLTVGRPAVLVGNSPEAMSVIKFPDREPCVAKGSIVPVTGAVLYCSPNGLMAIDLESIANVTAKLCTRDEWRSFWSDTMVAARYASWYVAYTDNSNGYALALPPDEAPSLVRLDRLGDVLALDTDRRDGTLHILQTAKVSQFDALADNRFACTWRSKAFVVPQPTNFGALQCLFSSLIPDATALQNQADALTWNLERFAEGPLDPLGFTVLGGPSPLQDDVTLPATAIRPYPGAPLGGEPLYNIPAMVARLHVRVTVIADGQVRWSAVLTDNRIHRLPSGYKATTWHVELSSNAEIQRLVVAETGKECAGA